MLIFKKHTSLAVVCLLCACSAVKIKEAEPLAAKQQRIAEQLISCIINGDYDGAYRLYSPLVTQKFPLRIMKAIQEQANNRLGKPISYGFISQVRLDASATRVSESASKTYRYDVVFRKGDVIRSVPMLITFDGGDYITKLLSHRFLVDDAHAGKR